MPELPEVETIVRALRADGLVGRKILRAQIFWPKAVSTPARAQFVRGLRGRTIRGVTRRGKFIVMSLSGGWFLLIHLRMTGHLTMKPAGTAARKRDSIVFTLDNGQQVHFSDSRKFGRVWLVREAASLLGGLGPEPLELTAADFCRALRARSRQLKPLLLDQTFIAGIGNIYADEALWAARLHPQRKADTVSARQAAELHRAIQMVLRRGIRNLGTTLGGGQTNFVLPQGERGRNQEQLQAYGQAGETCSRCGARIRRLLVGQRATHVCPTCQPLPRRKAARQ